MGIGTEAEDIARRYRKRGMLMRIGTFRSLKNPKKRYPIFRMGMTKVRGGNGVTWVCGCRESSKHDPCIHLKCLWSYAKSGNLPSLLVGNMITLTKRGRHFFVREHFHTLQEPKAFVKKTKMVAKKLNKKTVKKPNKKITSTRRCIAKRGIGGFGT